MEPGTNGWKEWSRHVLIELERLDESDKATKKCMVALKIKVAEQAIRTGLLAAVGAAIPVLASILLQIYLYTLTQ